MFIPIATDTSVRRTPWANYGLIAVNVLIYMLPGVLGGDGRNPTAVGLAVNRFLSMGVLDGAHPRLYQFITYQFLHGGFGHIAGNMLFLYIFGNAVNAKMGDLPYLLFYLAGGVFAAAGYGLLNDHSLLGASGSIAAITTAYLALFPRSNMTILYWWFFIGTFQLPSTYMILVKMILWDNIIAPHLSGPANVAFSAHVAGYAFGFVATIGLLALRTIPRDQFDIIALCRRALQRRSMRAAMDDPTARLRAQYGRVARPVTVDQVHSVDTSDIPSDPVTQLRLQIAEALAHNDRTTAADLYEKILHLDPKQVLSRPQQLEVANQLMMLNRLPQAAAAYEKYLSAYGANAGEEAVHVRLLLGIIYARDLQQYEVAEGHLWQCLNRLTDEKRRQQCQHWLNVSAQALGRPGIDNPPGQDRDE